MQTFQTSVPAESCSCAWTASAWPCTLCSQLAQEAGPGARGLLPIAKAAGLPVIAHIMLCTWPVSVLPACRSSSASCPGSSVTSTGPTSAARRLRRSCKVCACSLPQLGGMLPAVVSPVLCCQQPLGLCGAQGWQRFTSCLLDLARQPRQVCWLIVYRQACCSRR